MLVITSFLEQQAIRAGEHFNSTQRNVISVIVFISNMFVLGLPVLRTLTEVPLASRARRAVSVCVRKDNTPVPPPTLQPPREAAREWPAVQQSPMKMVVGEIAMLVLCPDCP
jgi:hypothetical protein